MAVILVSLVIWAILMAIWSPAELWPHVPEVSVATEGLVKAGSLEAVSIPISLSFRCDACHASKEMARNTPRPIQLPGHSSANETRAAGPRARVNVSWSSLDISGNATDAVAENSTGLPKASLMFPGVDAFMSTTPQVEGVQYLSVARAGVLMALAIESVFPAESDAVLPLPLHAATS